MNHLKSLVANIRKALQQVRIAAEQFNAADPWATLLRYVSDRIAPESSGRSDRQPRLQRRGNCRI